MGLILPNKIAKPLTPGDEVLTSSISSAINDEKSIFEGLKILEGWGLIIHPEKLNTRRWGYLAGNDEIRYQQLHPPKSTPLIAFAKGGWGAARLLEYPQPWQPGWLLGYSDISAILLARLAAGFDGGVHGPLLTTLPDEPDWSKSRLKAILFGEKVPDLMGEGWLGGIASGPLVVTNLTVGSHLIGSKYFPNLKGAILVLEDVGEDPYRIDRMLTHWRLAGLFKEIAGLAFGQFNRCKSPETVPILETFTVDEVLRERSKDLKIPVVGELPIGHCCGNASLPLGRKAKLDGNNGKLSLLAY